MHEVFVAQSLVETRTAKEKRRFELTFVDARGSRQTISVPVSVAVDLAPVLGSLAADLGGLGGPQFTKVPRSWAVGRAHHERMVLLRFDDDPPYGLDLDEAADLCREMREETEIVAQMKAPARQ
jgi:hypothetical protein